MRKICYSVAMSLDGYIARPDGAYDWIPMDPDIDLAAMFAGFDTVLMGRKTFEITLEQGPSPMPGLTTIVFSKTLDPSAYPDVTVVATDAAATTRTLREQPGKDIWLMGGGQLFRGLLEADLVDTVEVAIVPILLGSGIPMLPEMTRSTRLRLEKADTYPSGMALMRYAVQRETA